MSSIDSKKETKVDTKYYDELFKRIKESDEFKEPESLDILYENVLDQIAESDQELKKCSASFHVDFFIYKSKPEHFSKLFELITLNDARMTEFISDMRLSRVFEACLLCAGDKIGSDQTASEELIRKCFASLGDHLVENFLAILETQNGIFTLRTFLRVIGKPDPMESSAQEDKNKKPARRAADNRRQGEPDQFNIKNVKPKLVPESWGLEDLLKRMSKRLVEINVLEIGLIPSASPCISLLLRKLVLSSASKKAAKCLVKVHEQISKKANSFNSMIQDAIGSRFIETFLYCCPIDILVEHYLNEHIIPNIVAYSKHIYANYPIQTLLKYRLQNDHQISVLYEAILENLDSIINLHSDLIFKNYLLIELIEACQKVPELDLNRLVERIMKFFGCEAEEDRVHFLRVLMVYEKMEDVAKESPVDQALFAMDLKPIGCTIACKLVECDDKFICKSLNALTANELEFLCTSNVGSHFIQQCLRVYCQKGRNLVIQSIFDRLKGRFLIVSTNRSGSFVMDTIWAIASLKQRIALVEELKPNEVQLRNDQFARFLANKMGLNYYKRKPDDWKEMQASEFKKKKMFADLIDSGAEKPGQSQQKKSKASAQS